MTFVRDIFPLSLFVSEMQTMLNRKMVVITYTY